MDASARDCRKKELRKLGSEGIPGGGGRGKEKYLRHRSVATLCYINIRVLRAMGYHLVSRYMKDESKGITNSCDSFTLITVHRDRSFTHHTSSSYC
jgi:hypothetical protein